MAEPAVYHLAVEPEEPHTADAAPPETAPLAEAFTAILEISQDVRQAACPVSEEKSESTDGQTDVTPSSPQSKAWLPGSRCRAVYSADGLVYPAVVQWVRGERCCVRFDSYDNEEETDVSELLRVDELHGPARATAARSNSLRFIPPIINSDWKRRRRREDAPSDRPEAKVKDEFPPQNKEKKEPEKPTSQGFGFVPPFPPPPQTNSGDWPPFLPPPPIWTFGGKDSASDSMSNMLVLWYMCGFHTGSYMTQQKFKSKD